MQLYTRHYITAGEHLESYGVKSKSFYLRTDLNSIPKCLPLHLYKPSIRAAIQGY